jgi:hypothetical protein
VAALTIFDSVTSDAERLPHVHLHGHRVAAIAQDEHGRPHIQDRPWPRWD